MSLLGVSPYNVARGCESPPCQMCMVAMGQVHDGFSTPAYSKARLPPPSALSFGLPPPPLTSDCTAVCFDVPVPRATTPQQPFIQAPRVRPYRSSDRIQCPNIVHKQQPTRCTAPIGRCPKRSCISASDSTKRPQDTSNPPRHLTGQRGPAIFLVQL